MIQAEGHMLRRMFRRTSSKEEMERKTENQVERLVKKRYGKCGVKGGGRTGQDKVEENNIQNPR